MQEASQKIIDVETAVQMLSLVMPHSAHTEPFTEYLTEQTEYKTINMDQWTGYLRFTQEVLPLRAVSSCRGAMPASQDLHQPSTPIAAPSIHICAALLQQGLQDLLERATGLRCLSSASGLLCTGGR